MEAYRARYIATGKFAPLKHFMVRARVLARGRARDRARAGSGEANAVEN